MLFKSLGVKVVAGSVDSVADTAALAEGLRLGYVSMLAELDGPAVAASTHAAIQTGDRTFLHATGFILDPEGGSSCRSTPPARSDGSAPTTR